MPLRDAHRHDEQYAKPTAAPLSAPGGIPRPTTAHLAAVRTRAR